MAEPTAGCLLSPFTTVTRCLVPHFDGAFLSHDSKDALWDKFYTAAPDDGGGPSSDTT